MTVLFYFNAFALISVRLNFIITKNNYIFERQKEIVMETELKPKRTKTSTEVQKKWEALKLNMTTAEFEEYIHKLEDGEFESLSESKAAFFKWVQTRKK